jgi:serine protease AprX
MAGKRFYIKVVLPKQGQEKKNTGGGKTPEPLKPVTPGLRQQLLSQIGQVEEVFALTPPESRVVAARVRLEPQAQAKSHRPDKLFAQETCPIIGAGVAGELYVKMTPQGIKALRNRIAENTSRQMVKAISTVQEISPVSAEQRLSGSSPRDVLEAAPKSKKKKSKERRLIKVKLFDLGEATEQQAQTKRFERLLKQQRLPFTRQEVFENQDIYVVECATADDIAFLANTLMVRSVGRVPVFRTFLDAGFEPRPTPSSLLPLKGDPKNYPIVGVVDSGIARNITALTPWVYDRKNYVAVEDENTQHGTFIGGLFVWAHELNPELLEVGAHPCRLLDVQVLPNSDPLHGHVGEITEGELLESLEECLQEYANEVKVWNLSIGSDEICRRDQFSDFAVKLDDLQEKYGVTFVIAAGNFQGPPLLCYPRDATTEESGRITAPADSVLGITVAAVAQCDHPSSGMKLGEPSPFSRHGLGPNYIQKPDLTHYGGNAGLDRSNPIGIVSINDEDSVIENVGTSFSTTLIARQLAYVYHRITPTPSPTVARAILTHSARDLRTYGRVKDVDTPYLGFGTPLNVDDALECQPWMTTLVFAETLRPGYYLEWDDFPYPESLINDGKFYGDISMTLAFPPLRGSTWGAEYCETYVEAHFGVWRDGKDREGKLKEMFHGLVPPEHTKVSKLYEAVQVEKLRKWAPVRTHHKLLKNGVTGKRWRLKLEMLCRHGVEESAVQHPQDFALILTIADPRKRAPIYDEMARILRTRYRSQDLILRPSVQVRPGT